MGNFPPWLKKTLVSNRTVFETKRILSRYSIGTVCESGRCPNLNECFSRSFATFLILGRYCTRSCRFCSVEKGVPGSVDGTEPARIAAASRELRLRRIVITSVTRDDLTDGGAAQFADTITTVRGTAADAVIEVLVPDFRGAKRSVETVLAARPDIFGHNIETVKRLYEEVRPEAHYERSLSVLSIAKSKRPGQMVKSALLVGMGETEEEVVETMRDLRGAGCDILAIGQYLSPGNGHMPVRRFVEPHEFFRYKDAGERLGFSRVSAGPFVRSSYYAG
ncbi:MAG: lipoyl synthase [Candidatus Omnitrophota bacterium]